jgi:hypothetical protein
MPSTVRIINSNIKTYPSSPSPLPLSLPLGQYILKFFNFFFLFFHPSTKVQYSWIMHAFIWLLAIKNEASYHILWSLTSCPNTSQSRSSLLHTVTLFFQFLKYTNSFWKLLYFNTCYFSSVSLKTPIKWNFLTLLTKGKTSTSLIANLLRKDGS